MSAAPATLDLDDVEGLIAADRDGLLRAASMAGAQTRAVAAALTEGELDELRSDQRPRTVTWVCGRGMSGAPGAAGTVLAAALGATSSIPLVVTPDVPPWIGALDVVVVAGTDHPDLTTQALLWLAAAAVGLGLILGTLRRVVSRPQAPSAPDLLAADDALRARAATVLAGSTIAAVGLCTSQLFALVGRLSTSGQDDWTALGVGVMLLVMVVGYLVAVTASPARRSRVEAVRAAP